MKKTLVLLMLGLVACGSSVANAMLSNGGFDILDPAGTQQLGQTPTGWTVAASRGATNPYDDAVASENFADKDSNPTGSGLFFKAFTGNPPWDPAAGSVDVDVYQDNPGTPGMLYKLHGWFGAEDNYSGFVDPAANSLLAIDFLDGGNNVIGGNTLDLEAAGLGDPSAGGLNYEEFWVMATAPAGTVSVRSRITMLDGVFNQDPGQAFVADSLTLICVPEPSSIMLAGLALVGMVAGRRRVA